MMDEDNSPFDFRSMVVNSLDNLLASGKIGGLIEAAIEKTMKDLIHDSLKSYSDFGETIKKKIAEALKINDAFDLPSYNDFIVKLVKLKTEQHLSEAIAGPLNAFLDDVLEQPPAEIKFSEVLKAYRQQVVSNRHGCECGPTYLPVVYVYVQGSESANGYKHVFLDEKEPSGGENRRYSCRYQFAVTDKGEVFSVKIAGVDSMKSIFVGKYYEFDKLLYQMYIAKTKVVFDDGGEYQSDEDEADED